MSLACSVSFKTKKIKDSSTSLNIDILFNHGLVVPPSFIDTCLTPKLLSNADMTRFRRPDSQRMTLGRLNITRPNHKGRTQDMVHFCNGTTRSSNHRPGLPAQNVCPCEKVSITTGEMIKLTPSDSAWETPFSRSSN